MTSAVLVPGGTAIRSLPTPEDASPATPRSLGLLAPVRASRKSREALRKAGETPENAFEDLHHAILLAKAEGETVPCLGRDADDWVSEDYERQRRAAEGCLDCPMAVFTQCQRYADVTGPKGGTWAGVSSDSARKPAADTPKAQREAAKRGNARPHPKSKQCACDCGGWTRGGRYLPGHDSQHLARLVRLTNDGAMTREGALARLGSPGLRAEFGHRVKR